MAGKEQSTHKLQKGYVIYFFLLCIAIAIIVKILIIQYSDGDRLRAKAKKIAVKEVVIIADRGNVYSHDGELIATSIPRFDIYVDFSKNTVSDKNFEKNIDSLAICLHNTFADKSFEEYRALLQSYRNDNETYGLVRRNLDYNQLLLVREFPLFRLGRFSGGIIEEKRDKRVHPFGLLAQRTIGFSREDFKVGLEGAYDKQLAGRNGKRMKQRLPNGRFVPINEDFVVEPMQGIDIVTTLDMRIQDVAESALLEHLIFHDAKWGCAVLMEVETGEIRAIANLEKHTDGQYYEMYNHAVGTRYEPGSTFKLFSMLVMLEDGGLNLDEIVHTGKGSIKVGDDEVFDSHPLGDISVRGVFEQSSNVGTIMLVTKRYKNQPEKFVDKLYEMNLHLPMGIDIRGEQPADIKYPHKQGWTSTTLASMSYGYGITITPLQLLTYYNAVANNGKLVRPLFVKEFRLAGKTIQEFNPVVLRESICSKETAQILQSLLEGVVERGTAKNLGNVACKIAGKTATARIWDNDMKEYSQRDYNATFVGYFPADNPKYSCIVVVNKPAMGQIYGSSVAAPVFRDIAEIVFATELEIHDPLDNQKFVGLNALPLISKVRTSVVQKFLALLPINQDKIHLPKSEWISLTGDSIPEFQSITFSKRTMPDVKGMNIRDAVSLLEGMGYIVHAYGKGRVFKQSVIPGTPFQVGHKVILHLKPM